MQACEIEGDQKFLIAPYSIEYLLLTSAINREKKVPDLSSMGLLLHLDYNLQRVGRKNWAFERSVSLGKLGE